MTVGVDKDTPWERLLRLERHAEEFVDLESWKEIKNIYSVKVEDLSDTEDRKKELIKTMARSLNGALSKHGAATCAFIKSARNPVSDANAMAESGYDSLHKFLIAFDQYFEMRLDEVQYM